MLGFTELYVISLYKNVPHPLPNTSVTKRQASLLPFGNSPPSLGRTQGSVLMTCDHILYLQDGTCFPAFQSASRGPHLYCDFWLSLFPDTGQPLVLEFPDKQIAVLTFAQALPALVRYTCAPCTWHSQRMWCILWKTEIVLSSWKNLFNSILILMDLLWI